jgi:hypothetical protein
MNAPIFIVGFQRSGTTLLRVMLNAHPEVAVPLDTVGLWNRYEAQLSRYGDLHSLPARQAIVRDLLSEERIRLWETPFTKEQILERWSHPGFSGLIAAFYQAYADLHGKARWGDKDPGNMLRIDQLNRWFPEALFIHIIRDGRDACLSQLRQDFGHTNLLECAHDWREEVQWVRRMGGLLGNRYHELKYEVLIQNAESELRKICQFAGLTYRDQMLKYHEQIAEAVPGEKRHIWPLIDQPPQPDNANHWKHLLSRGEQVCFEKRAGHLLHELEYETFPGTPSGGYLIELRSIADRALAALKQRFSR